MRRPLVCECGKCHTCGRREYMRKRWADDPEGMRAYARANRAARKAKDPDYAAKYNAYQKEWRDRTGYDKTRDPQKIRARRKLQELVAKGKIKRQPCEVCGEPNAHAHHEDYSKPLDVKWLCVTHHSELHRKCA